MNEWIVSVFVLPLIIGMGGEVSKKLIVPLGDSSTGWRKIFWITFPLHAMLTGALVGIPLHNFNVPVPEAFGKELLGAMIAGTMSGAISTIGYSSIVKTLKRFLSTYAGPQA
jgi:hypothetical protein